jgi:mitochondrial fission protein ELM1
VTASRRTGEAAAASLSAALTGSRHRFWSPWTEGAGANPYFGYLALADQILVTSDSVSMISEACATGRPVLVERLPADGDKTKFEKFHQRLIDKNLIHWFSNGLDGWDNGRLDDMDALGRELRWRLAPA